MRDHGMAAYLSQHPGIGMCPRKETHHFGSDMHSRLAIKDGQHPHGHRRYMDLFKDVQGERRRGEASVWYLYSATAATDCTSGCSPAGAPTPARACPPGRRESTARSSTR